MKKKGRGKAAIFQDGDFQKLIDSTVGENHRMIFNIAYWTGARVGEVRQLPVVAVFNSDGKVEPYITFWSETTKNQENRQVPVHGTLKALLERYWLITPGLINQFYLFPGQSSSEAIQFQSVDDAFRRAILKSGLGGKGYACHSMRRSAITKMHNAGIATGVIMQVSGHKSLSSLQHYLHISDEQIQGAISTL